MIRAYKRIAGKKWARDIRLCTVTRPFLCQKPLLHPGLSRKGIVNVFCQEPPRTKYSGEPAMRRFLIRAKACLEIKVVWRLAYPRKKHNLRMYYVVQSGVIFLPGITYSSQPVAKRGFSDDSGV